jgi:hypothetical protein
MQNSTNLVCILTEHFIKAESFYCSQMKSYRWDIEKRVEFKVSYIYSYI